MSNAFKISEAAVIALHAMVWLALRKNLKTSVRDIASLFDISEAHLSKVLQRLTKSGYVKPERGPKGGYVLIPSPSKISLLEIYELFDGRLDTDKCLLGSYICGGNNCILGNLLHNINKQTKKYLEETKISMLIHVCKGMDK